MQDAFKVVSGLTLCAVIPMILWPSPETNKENVQNMHMKYGHLIRDEQDRQKGREIMIKKAIKGGNEESQETFRKVLMGGNQK